MVMDPSPLAETGRHPALAAWKRGSGPCGRGRARRARWIELNLKPVESPVKMRAGRASGHAHLSNYLSAHDIVANLHCLPALVQIGCGPPVTVVENCQTALEVEIRSGESDTRRSRRRNRRAGPRRNIDPEM